MTFTCRSPLSLRPVRAATAAAQPSQTGHITRPHVITSSVTSKEAAQYFLSSSAYSDQKLYISHESFSMNLIAPPHIRGQGQL